MGHVCARARNARRETPPPRRTRGGHTSFPIGRPRPYCARQRSRDQTRAAAAAAARTLLRASRIPAAPRVPAQRTRRRRRRQRPPPPRRAAPRAPPPSSSPQPPCSLKRRSRQRQTCSRSCRGPSSATALSSPPTRLHPSHGQRARAHARPRTEPAEPHVSRRALVPAQTRDAAGAAEGLSARAGGPAPHGLSSGSDVLVKARSYGCARAGDRTTRRRLHDHDPHLWAQVRVHGRRRVGRLLGVLRPRARDSRAHAPPRGATGADGTLPCGAMERPGRQTARIRGTCRTLHRQRAAVIHMPRE